MIENPLNGETKKIKRTLLYDTAFTWDNTVALNNSADNYDLIEIRIGNSTDSSGSRGGVILTSGLYSIGGFYPVRTSGDYVRVTINGTSFRFIEGTSGIYIHKIVGINN